LIRAGISVIITYIHINKFGVIILKIIEIIKGLFSDSTDDKDKMLAFKIKCNKCKNINEIKVLKTYDIATVYEDDQPGNYMLKKYIVCPDCYNKIHLEIFFDKSYQIITSECDNGELLK